MKYLGVLFICVFSLFARETVLFDDIESLQRWYANQLKEKQLDTLSVSSSSDVSERNISDNSIVTENISSFIEDQANDVNLTTIADTSIELELNNTVNFDESNVSDLMTIMDQNKTKPIVIVKYVGNKKSQQLCESLSKEYIDFWNLLDLTLINATALILKKHDIKITEENLEIIRSAYYPNLSIGYGGEYYHGFSRTSQAGVGGTYYPSTSSYRDALSFKFNHELYKFGATDLKVKIGKKEIELVKSELELQAEDISRRLLSYYTSVLRAQYFIEYKSKIKSIQNEILQKKWRLYDSGQITKITIAKDQLKLVSLEKEIAQQQIRMMQAIKSIEKLANIQIDFNRSKFAMLEPKNIHVKTFEESAGARYLRLQIEKKLHELELVRKDYLPGVYASGDYVMLGSDKALFEAIKDIKRNSWDIGISINWDIFNGYKTDKTIDRIKYELRKLTEQYRLAKIDFEAKQQQRDMLRKSIEKMLKIESKIYEQTCEQEEMLSKLQGVGLVDALQLDYVEISKLQSELDFRLAVIDKVYQTIASELIR